MSKLSHLTRTSLLLGFFFALDKILAFLRSIIIARQFQLSHELDAFNVANNLPDMLFALISGGALAMAFIPVLSEYLTNRGRAATWDLFSRIANIAFVATASIAVIIAIFAAQIVRSQIGIAPGFGEEQQNLIIELMRLNLISTCIFSLSGLIMAGLQANQHFFLPALAPILYNIGQIFGALVLSPKMPYSLGPVTLPAFGMGVPGLVYGVILGSVMHLAIQIPGLLKYQFHWKPSLDIRNPGVLEVFKVVGPRLLTMFFIQLMFIARDNFASRLNQTGAVSSLTYGWMIMQVPETLIGTAIGVALLPTLAEYFARKDWEMFRTTVEKALRVLVALTLPIAMVIAVGLRPLVTAIFHFDEAGTSLLTWTTRIYMVTLCGYTVQEILARSFYARKEAVFPLYAVLIRIGIYIAIGILAVSLYSSIGAPIIAAAELSLTVEALVMLGWLNQKMVKPIRAWSALVRGLIASLLSGIVAYGLARYLPGPEYISALGGMACGIVVALPIIWTETRQLFRL